MRLSYSIGEQRSEYTQKQRPPLNSDLLQDIILPTGMVSTTKNHICTCV